MIPNLVYIYSRSYVSAGIKKKPDQLMTRLLNQGKISLLDDEFVGILFSSNSNGIEIDTAAEV